MVETKKTEETTYIIPYSTGVIEQVKKYIDLMKLPPESASSVVRALTNYAKLTEVIKSQLALSLELKKLLVDTRTPIADVPLSMIENFVIMHQIPFNAMTWIEGRPYPKADGLKWKLQADPRILKSVKTSKLPSPEVKDNFMVGYHCDIVFWNGETYDSDGWADFNELQTRRRSSQVSIGFLSMIAETRSIRRAIQKCLGLPAGVAEEVQDGVEFENAEVPVKTTVVVPVPKAVIAETPTNLAIFLAKCQTELLLSPQEVVARLQLKSITEITNFKDSWDYLKQTKGGQNVNK